jgi:hypothetical protein
LEELGYSLYMKKGKFEVGSLVSCLRIIISSINLSHYIQTSRPESEKNRGKDCFAGGDSIERF